MPTKPCLNEEKIVAQTLFLGASVSSFNNSVGWGSQPSQLTVNLIDDSPPLASAAATACGTINPFPNLIGAFGNANHYYNTRGDSLYVRLKPDGTAEQYNSNSHDISERMVAGKVYYRWEAGNFNSYYWIKQDPGFFGSSTTKAPDFTDLSAGVKMKYDIINTPVYFKMGSFGFGGLVQSWTTSLSNSGKGYTVTINSMHSLLDSCYVILDKFSGSIFSKIAGVGSPKNHIKSSTNITYTGGIADGNLPNVFNVYGFLESCGYDNFGVARRNERGISVNKVIDALSVLTSSTTSGQSLTTTNTSKFTDFASKTIFSPYGRIMAKNMQVEYSNATLPPTEGQAGSGGTAHPPYKPITGQFNAFGVIPYGACEFILDLSEIPRLPNSFRISEPVISIMNLLNLIGEQTGHDILVECGPMQYYDAGYNVIKIKTVSRLGQPRTNVIENVVNDLACNNYSISNYTLGKERNETPNRSMIVGASQQRLYQAKSYRLGYTQTNFILNPRNGRMVNYNQLGYVNPDNTNVAISSNFYNHGKYKFPNFCTTRNPTLISYYGSMTEASGVPVGMLTAEQNHFGAFTATDANWDDTKETSPSLITNMSKPHGNYEYSQTIDQAGIASSRGAGARERWLPLYADVICPFFGYVHDEELSIKPSENNDFRQIRPVWFDTWTGQSCVVVRSSELPRTSVPLTNGFFTATNQRCSASTAPDTTTTAAPPPPPPPDSDTPTTTTRAPSSRGSYSNGANNISKSQCYNKHGHVTKFSISYIVISESEIRAALAGFDNFLVYSLAKYYKPDLIEALRLSYRAKIYQRLIDLGHTVAEAEKGAAHKTNWYWNLTSSNIANDELKPGYMAPDRNQGSSYIPEDALKDLQILHKFVAGIGKYYGKKYMVTAPKLASYNDEEADVILPTAGGNAYIFSGAGRLYYNYEPTNDGAWEEYGNFIDDTIVVGSPSWYALTDEFGKIKPILGYNATEYFDHLRYAVCTMSAQNNSSLKSSYDGYWDWESYLYLMERYQINCKYEDYIFPSLDFSTLSSDQYVLETVYEALGSPAAAQLMGSVLAAGSPTSTVPGYDAFGDSINTTSPDGTGGAIRKKLYIPTSVEENFIYLNPEKLEWPKFLIDSPGVYLNHSSSQYAQDPNRTVIANVSIEDVLMYMKVTAPASRDYTWIRYMLSYTMPINRFSETQSYEAWGNFGSTSNQSALRIEISPKAAHPVFAAIPIKSNQFCYGPWVNHPYGDYASSPNSFFPSGYENPTPCSTTPVNITSVDARNAINNSVGNTEVEVIEDMNPWLYGGASQLDNAAYRYITTKINHQSIIETAQVEMPGLPLFNLGGVFNRSNVGACPIGGYSSSGQLFRYTDVKYTSSAGFGTNVHYPGIVVVPSIGTDSNTLNFDVLVANSPGAVTKGPIITNIQTSVGQNGITTTYSFRTYSRKLGLFNKEQSDLVKKNNLANFRKNKQINQISTQSRNLIINQRDALDKQRLEDSLNFNTAGFKSKLFGTSPSTVLIGRASPFIQEPKRTPATVVDFTKYSNPGDLATVSSAPTAWSVPSGADASSVAAIVSPPIPANAAESINLLSLQGRYVNSVGLYERKEVDSEINKQYGLNAAMSLDGLLSPVSFYPTLRDSTFAYSLYTPGSCPFCNGSRSRAVTYSKYLSDGSFSAASPRIFCDKCTTRNNRLNATLTAKKDTRHMEKLPPYIITTSTDMNTLLNLNTNILPYQKSLPPINLVTLNPIVVTYSEFKNSNSQNYIGAHPDGDHGDITSYSTGFKTKRPFVDRLRHSIEIVGRGAVPPNVYGYSLETSKNLIKYDDHPSNTLVKSNLDYYSEDIILNYYRDKLEPNNSYVTPEMNYRFLALRGPLTMHGWGYDTEGYPVPNAADEPYAIDDQGRPMRFKLKEVNLGTTTYNNLLEGDTFKLTTGDTTSIFAKTFNKQNMPSSITDATSVTKIKIVDDYGVNGGFDPGDATLTNGFKGDIISKTQIFTTSNYWTKKKKMKEFYLNWAERQDLWPVGPIDLRWDESRRLWTAKEDPKVYKFIYVTLEEDLVKEPDYDETYPTKAFIDDIEYSQEPLPNGSRRLVYVKDKAGYTAPKGTKLLCRYNIDSGFYEPISKPVMVAKGTIASSSTATIEMHYVQGRRSGVVPTSLVTFDNPMSYTVARNDKGIFTYINGLWTLTAKKQ